MFSHKAIRAGAALLLAGSLVLVSCEQVDELLEAENPANINEDQLDDESLINTLVASVQGALAGEYDNDFIWVGSLPTDDQVSGVNWPTSQELGRRILSYELDVANSMFRSHSRVRFMADSVASRLTTLLPKVNADPAKDRRMALVLAHAGYAYTLMAEYMCEATINVGSKIYTPVELATIGIEKFEQAITIANAVGASANDVKNLANVGMARAAMVTGNKAKTMAAAAQVPASFIWWVEYKDQVNNNIMVEKTTGGSHQYGVHPALLKNWGTYGQSIPASAQTDPRVQFNPTPRTGHDARTILYTPFQPQSYSGWVAPASATAAPTRAAFTNDTDIRLGSYLDAMHNYYEAAGPSGTGPEGTTLDFVNKRRAVGRQAPVTLTGTALMAELREQRYRDLFMGGFRIGDLRRWKAQGVGDFFPQGTHPNPVLGEYGTAECFPIPLSEYIGNPNIKK
jgi:hypothetical protein